MRFHILKNNHSSDLPPVQEVFDEDGYGRWNCAVDFKEEEGKFFNFIEAHKSSAWNNPDTEKKVTLRIGEYSVIGGIRIGQCVMLEKEQVAQLRNMLNLILDEM